ncbi:ribonuclease III [Myceligenerans indicum]|uniref:Ribonuclease 3 n=1 Tax=Myceligenerans indicum TaxID=2593663 RepID=A0ABS1LPA5_9MICO|nr:ribonuclease III [Myceligenerans indicum]MBL0888008.1 ribonuclease III [Myceligenerans indicum]
MARRAAPTPSEPGELLEKLGVVLDPELLVLALTHRSFAHEAGGIPTNERLEFLGDTVLGLVVTEALYRRHPGTSEGDLARMRAATVSQRSLAKIARTLGLGRYVLLGKGEIRTRGFDKDSILSDTVEALIGATYLSHGLEASRELVHRLVDEQLDVAAGLGAGLDWKTSLQEAAAERGLGAPDYLATFEGPEHARIFHSEVVIDGVGYGQGSGSAKKHAEQEAAEEAYKALITQFPAQETDGAGAGQPAGKAATEPVPDGRGSRRPASGPADQVRRAPSA